MRDCSVPFCQETEGKRIFELINENVQGPDVQLIAPLRSPLTNFSNQGLRAAADGRDYLGVEQEAVSGLPCHHWRWPVKWNFSHYYEAVASGRPVRWTFPAHQGLEDWYFVQS